MSPARLWPYRSMPTTRWCVAKGCPGNRTRFACRPLQGTEQNPSCPPIQEPTPTHADNPPCFPKELAQHRVPDQRVLDPSSVVQIAEDLNITALDNSPPLRDAARGGRPVRAFSLMNG